MIWNNLQLKILFKIQFKRHKIIGTPDITSNGVPQHTALILKRTFTIICIALMDVSFTFIYRKQNHYKKLTIE